MTCVQPAAGELWLAVEDNTFEASYAAREARSSARQKQDTYNSYGEPQTYNASVSGSSIYSVNYGTRDALGRIVHKTEAVTR